MPVIARLDLSSRLHALAQLGQHFAVVSRWHGGAELITTRRARANSSRARQTPARQHRVGQARAPSGLSLYTRRTFLPLTISITHIARPRVPCPW